MDTETEARFMSNEQQISILRGIAAQHLLSLKDLEHNVTILVGVAGSQGQDIRAMKSDSSEIKTDLSAISSRLSHVESRLDSIDSRLDTIIALLQQKGE